MKKLFKFFPALLCMLVVSNSASAITGTERAAQQSLKNYLTTNNVNCKIDNSDESVNFQYKNILYWVTFKEQNGGMLYTLHRAPIKMESEKAGQKEADKRRIEIATYTSNILNNKYAYKTYVNNNRVEFEFPVFAATPEEYNKVFMKLLRTMENSKADFDAYYKTAKLKVDSIHRYWQENDTSTLIIPQQGIQVKAKDENTLKIEGVEFRVVDAMGNVISDYGKSIRKSEIKYIQPMVLVSASKKGIYHIGVVIKTPAKYGRAPKTLLPDAEATRTLISTVEVDKKAKDIELGKFGSNDGKFWEAGDYEVIFYQDGNEIYKTSFSVL